MFTRLPLATKRLLVVMLVVTLVLRGWYVLTRSVPSYNPDELALLMNARFVATAGVDEWGKPWPLVFRSFGDAKLPGYVWTTMLTGRMMQWHPLSVRLPALVAACALPFLVAQLGRLWWRQRDMFIATIALFLLVPWVYHYGSVGFEALWALLWWVSALVLIFSRRVTWWKDALAGAVFFGAAITYNAPLLMVPVLALAAFLWRWPQKVAGGRMVGCLGLAAMAAATITWQASAQKTGIALFQDPTLLALYPAYRERFVGVPGLSSLVGNQWVYFAQHIVARWWQSWSWDFLLVRGGNNPWHTIPGYGHLTAAVWVGAVAGLGGLFGVMIRALSRRRWRQSREAVALLSMVGSSLLPAIITVDAPHATRSLWFLCCLLLLASWTWLQAWRQLARAALPGRQVLLAFALLLMVGEWSRWWWGAPAAWQTRIDAKWHAGLMAALVREPTRSATRVTIVDPAGVLYVYAVTQSALSPQDFLASVRRSAPDTAGLVRVEAVGKYRFVFAAADAEAPGVIIWPSGPLSWDTREL